MNRKYLIDNFQYDLFGEIYASDATKVGYYGFPKLKPVTIIPTGQVRSFNYLLSTSDRNNYWFHCFCDDYQFNRLWTGFDFYIAYILEAKGFISSDFSMYRDYSDDKLIWNCYKNRVLDYAIQEKNANMIPTAGFGPERTWKWCFDGLPKQSTVAITTNGVLGDREAKRLFVGGLEALVDTLSPAAIVICGRYPEWIPEKYPQIKILGIPSYSQQWRQRGCA